MGTGDGIFHGDICRWGKVTKRQKMVLRGTNSRTGTQEHPSLIDTFFVAHTVNGEFLQDEDRRGDEEAVWLEGVSSEGTFSVLVRYCQHGPQPAQFESGGASGSGGCGDDEESADAQEDEDEDGDGDS
ncbi:hypothetical protein Tco_0920586 [Tanacetum coccineum]